MRASAFRDRWKLHIITVISSEILVPALRGIELYALEPHLCRPGKPLGGEKLLLRRVRPSRGTQRTPALFVVYPGDEPPPEPPQTRRRKTVHHAEPRPRKRLLVGYELRPAKLDLQNIVRNAYHVEDQLCTPAQRPCGDKREDVDIDPHGVVIVARVVGVPRIAELREHKRIARVGLLRLECEAPGKLPCKLREFPENSSFLSQAAFRL